MLKIVLLFVVFTSSSYATHSSCKKYLKNSFRVFTVKKNRNPKNILHYQIGYDSISCRLKSNGLGLVFPYWSMGEKSTMNTPCEGLTSLESRYFKVQSLNRVNDREATFSLGLMKELNSKFPEIKKSIRVSLSKVNGLCLGKAEIFVDGSEVKIDIASAIMSGLFGTNISQVRLSGEQEDGSNFYRIFND